MGNSIYVYDRYQAAVQAYGDVCATAPERWHLPNFAEFRELHRQLLPHAESGDMYCQYAIATILWLGLCSESEEQFLAGDAAGREAATRWWIASAMQGYWPALDNIATAGVGPEAQRAREAWSQLERERGDLVGSSHGMPVYGPNFVEELCKRFYGRVVPDQA